MLLSFCTAQLLEITTGTGIVLDPVYTLKGVRGMLAEMRTNPTRFLGKRVLYLHTGWRISTPPLYSAEKVIGELDVLICIQLLKIVILETKYPSQMANTLMCICDVI